MRGKRCASRLCLLVGVILLGCSSCLIAGDNGPKVSITKVEGINVLILLDSTGSMRTPLRDRSGQTCFDAGRQLIPHIIERLGTVAPKVNALVFPFDRAVHVEPDRCLIEGDIEGDPGLAKFRSEFQRKKIEISPGVGTFRRTSILQGLQQIDRFSNTSAGNVHAYPTWVFVITDLDDDESPQSDVDTFRGDLHSTVLVSQQTIDGRPLQLYVYRYNSTQSPRAAVPTSAVDSLLTSLQKLFPAGPSAAKANDDVKLPVSISQVSSDTTAAGRSALNNFEVTGKFRQMFLRGNLAASVSLADPGGKDVGGTVVAAVKPSSDNGAADTMALQGFVLPPITRGDQSKFTNPSVPFAVDVQTTYQPPWWRMKPTVLTGTIQFSLNNAALYEYNPQQANEAWLRLYGKPNQIQLYSLQPQGSNPATFQMSVPGNPWKLPVVIVASLVLLVLLLLLPRIIIGKKRTLALAVYRPGISISEDETCYRGSLSKGDRLVLGGDLSALSLPGSQAIGEVAVITVERSGIYVRPSENCTLSAEGTGHSTLELSGSGQFQIISSLGLGEPPITVTVQYQPNRFQTDDAAEGLVDDRDYGDVV